jgi:hypothetical protein
LKAKKEPRTVPAVTEICFDVGFTSLHPPSLQITMRRLADHGAEAAAEVRR